MVYVWMDGDEPRVEFDLDDENDQDKDSDAATVFCQNPVSPQNTG